MSLKKIEMEKTHGEMILYFPPACHMSAETCSTDRLNIYLNTAVRSA